MPQFTKIAKMFTLACFLSAVIAGSGAYLAACAMSKRSETPRKDQDRGWRPCQDGELGKDAQGVPVSVVGKLCVRYCSNYGMNSKCNKDEWKLAVKNYCEQTDFKFFQNGTFIFMDEDSAL